MKNIVLISLVVAASALILSGCSGGGAPEDPAPKGDAKYKTDKNKAASNQNPQAPGNAEAK